MNAAPIWTVRAFVSGGGRSVIEEWYAEQSATVRAAFDAAFRHLIHQPASNWVRPYIGTLKRDCDGLVEIRFKADSVQHRPIGCFGPGQGHQFTILAFAIEKDRKFVPPNVCKTALKRQDEVIKDAAGRSIQHNF